MGGGTMPDELDVLRQFRDETPGPSTDAWNRARAAVAAARAEEEPARHRPGWLPGQRSPGRKPGQRSPGRKPGRRRVLWMATAGVVAAGVAGLVVALLPGSPATRGTSAQIETTAFVTRVEHALARSDQGKFVGYARTALPPGYMVEPISPGGMRVAYGSGTTSPWSTGSLVRWSYRGVSTVSALTAAGRRVFAIRTAPVDGILTSTALLYRSRTWWHGVIGPVSGRGTPIPCGVPGIQLGTGGWPAFLRHQLSCGAYAKGGQQLIGGAEAVKLTGNGGRQVVWVNPRTYLPVRTIFSMPGGARLQTGFGWFRPTRARLAALHLTVPPGFRQVAPPAGHPATVPRSGG
jgi:hypothetical protein